jgi:hypothetical protein
MKIMSFGVTQHFTDEVDRILDLVVGVPLPLHVTPQNSKFWNVTKNSLNFKTFINRSKFVARF